MRELTKKQIAALRSLPDSPARLRPNWRPVLSSSGYRDLLDRGLIYEQWTWMDQTRPSVGITPKGQAVLAEMAS